MDAQIGHMPEPIKDDGRQHLHTCTTDSQAEYKDKSIESERIRGLRVSAIQTPMEIAVRMRVRATVAM